MRFICLLFLIFHTNLFASERELPVGTFRGISFSLEKNGEAIFSNKDVHYNKSTLQITKISSHVYEFTIAVYLQETPESKALSETKTLQNVVIATGGGIVEREENRLFLENEDKVIFLDSSPERQYERTKDSKKRPLLNDGDSLEILKKLYEERFNFYEAVSKKKISMDNLDTEEILKKIINFLDK